jgi:ParB-like chromosome segregation protein Spo0J
VTDFRFQGEVALCPIDKVVLDPRFQPMPAMTPDQRELLKDTMRHLAPTELDPIVIDDSLRVLDGHHRVQIARELGWTDILVRVRAGYSDDDNYAYALSVNAVRRDLTREQRQAMLEDAIKRLGHLSDRALGELCKVDGKTIAAHRAKTPQVPDPAGAEVPHVGRVGKDGKTYVNVGAAGSKPKKPATAAAERQRQYEALIQALDLLEGVTPRVVVGAVKGLDRDALFDRLAQSAKVLIEIDDALGGT